MVVTPAAPSYSPPLPALERGWAPGLRASPALWDIARAVGGGPFHAIHPQTFADNLDRMVTTLAQAGVNGTVYYGKKANKAAAWLRACTRPGAGVDVASVPELVQALGNGVTGDAIGVTGAVKPDGLLWLALRHGCLIAVDAPDELERIGALAREHDATARILLRVRPPSAPESRFGFAPVDLAAAVRRCRDLAVSLLGFSFHLDGYAPEPRAELASSLIGACADARALGHPADRISIGGGIACAYVTEENWRRFESGRHDGWFHAGRNPARTYPYHQTPTGADMVAAILAHDCSGLPLARRLRDAGIALLLEPGRALVDGAGFTAFPVLGCKPASEGHLLTTVAGLSMSLSEQWKGSEYLPDPILVRAGDGGPRPGTGASAVRTSVGGSSCMEYDVLTWRSVTLPDTPRRGDLLVYPNTAGYQMDKNESGFHQLPLPPKIVIDDDVTWRFDTELPYQEI